MSFLGITYLCDGFKLIFRKGIKRFCFAPIVIGILIYLLLGNFAIRAFASLMGWASAGLPDWLGFLIPLAWLFFGALALLIVGYTFAIVSMLIGSFFHGLLAEKIAIELGYRDFNTQWNTRAVIALVMHALIREGKKILYLAPRAIAVIIIVLLLNLTPIANILAPVVTFLWAGWSMAVHFIDYPADNDQINIPVMLTKMRSKRADCLGLGGATALLLSIPVINVIVVPAAVAAATKFWLIELSPVDKPKIESGTPKT